MIVDLIASSCGGESASNSAGGTSPRAWYRRAVLKLSTKLSASALSQASPTDPTEARTP
jgi:hypothetical protein